MRSRSLSTLLALSLIVACAGVAVGAPLISSRGVTWSFARSDRLAVEAAYTRVARGPAELIYFRRNRMSILDDGHGRLCAVTPRALRKLGRVPRGRSARNRLGVWLAAKEGLLIARVNGGPRVVRQLALHPEEHIRVGAGSRLHPYRVTYARVARSAVSRVWRDAKAVERPTKSRRRSCAKGDDARTDGARSPRLTARKGGLFAPTSFWNRPLSRAARLDSKSDVWVADLKRQMLMANPWVNTTAYSAPVYEVPPDQPAVRVTVDKPRADDLQAAFERVPIPDNAIPAAGLDKQLVVWQSSTDTLWEFWAAEKHPDGWHAMWGGRMPHVSSNPGYFLEPNWGATATGLPLLGGLMRIEELRQGRIDHALALGLPDTRAEWFAWPAQRTDGNLWSADAIPEGARFRIDPRLDLTKLNLAPIVRMMAEAVQRYGMVVRDKSGAVSFYAEDPTPTGTDPYGGASGFFGGQWINNLLREQFPWDSLQGLRARQECCWSRSG